MEPTTLTVEEATEELAGIEKWLTDIQTQLPAAQQRGMWLQGFLAGREAQ